MSAFECSVCIETYSQARLPRVLACGHTFCDVCVGALAKKKARKKVHQLKCPKCDQVSNVPATGYPINYDLLSPSVEPRGLALSAAAPSVVSEARPLGASEVKSEGKCSNCPEQAALFCQDCGDFCTACSAVVHRMLAFRYHTVHNIADKPKPKRMCSQHKDQEALLYCMQCECFGCSLCGNNSHNGHKMMEIEKAAAERKALAQQRFQLAKPNIDKLRSRQDKISDELKTTEHARATIAAAIDARCQQLSNALNKRRQQLQRDLTSMASVKLKNLQLMQERCTYSLSSLTQLEQDLQSPMDAHWVLKACSGWLSVARLGEEVDEHCINQGFFVSELDASMLTEAIARWGSVNDLLPVQGVMFEQGHICWSSLAGAVEYEVQIAKVGAVGEHKGDVDIDVKDNGYRSVYQGPEARWEMDFGECGEFAVRVRARFDHGWGPFSSVSLASAHPPVHNFSHANGRVSWSGNGALQYEVQIAGPLEAKEAKADGEAKYERVYQGSATTWSYSALKTPGEYLVRVRAQHQSGWGPFSPPFSFTLMMWGTIKKTQEIVLGSDADGLLRIARHNAYHSDWHSVMSYHPLSPPSCPMNASSAGVASFEVKVDRMGWPGDMFVGVSCALPSWSHVGNRKDLGVAYSSYQGYFYDGGVVRGGARYGAGDVIRVVVDFTTYTVNFFKNGERQGQPVILPQENRNRPLFAAVSLKSREDQVTLL